MAVTTMGDEPNTVCTHAGNPGPWSAPATWVMPTPSATDSPTTALERMEKCSEVIMRMPVMVMVANTEMVAPPITAWGMVVRMADSLGTSPATSRIREASVHGDSAHVLAVGGGGQAAEQGPDDGHHALGHNAAGQLPVGGHTVHAAHGGGGQVADGLHRVDDVHHRQGDAGAGLKLHAEVEGGRQLEPARRGHRGEVHHPQAQGHHIAHNHAPQDGPQLQYPLAEVLEKHHHRQGDQRHRPVLQPAEVLAARAPRHVPHRRGIEGQADGEDDGAGDEGREQLSDLLDENSKQDGHAAAHNLRPQNGGQVELTADGQQGGHVGEADAHDHRQAGADAAPDGVQLEQGGQGGDNEGHLDQQGAVAVGQAGGVGHHDSRGDDAHNGGNHVLEAQGDQLAGGRESVQGKNRCRRPGGGIRLMHKISSLLFLSNKKFISYFEYSGFRQQFQGENLV